MKLTSYQQGLLTADRRSVRRNTLARLLVMQFVALLSYGYYREIDGLADWQHGWLICGTIMMLVFNTIGLIFGIVATTTVRFIGFVSRKLTEATREEQFNAEIQADKSRFRVTVVDMVGKFGCLFSVNIIVRCLDIVVDGTLFVMLVTANHPTLAVFHAVILILQYMTLAWFRQGVRYLVSHLDDPLDGGVVDDQLMDKLIGGEND